MVSLGQKALSLNDFEKLLFSDTFLEVDKESLEKVIKSFEFLKDFSKNKILYGVNTGLGPMTQYKIEEKDQVALQYNLIRSHCTGCGDPLSEIDVKAAMISRLNSLIQGFSGIHSEAVTLLVQLINKNIIPVIPEHGGVGASGDLVQLSHLALVLIGEGEVFFDGQIAATKDIFKKFKIKPVSIHIREGLALINGTSVMTGIGIVNIINARNLINWMIIAASMLNEIVTSFDDHFSIQLNQVKKHSGQNYIAKLMNEILSDSLLIEKRSDHLYDKNSHGDLLEKKVQEYYSLRCIPQILGPIYETYQKAKEVLINELNSVSDNPVVDYINQDVYHGGNFHGDYVSFEMDKLKIAITKLSMLSERQLNYLLNDKLNNKLTPFINMGKLGLNLGLQGVQFTATSTTAENQMLANSMYVHSIPNNNDNQDIVSMGANSALITKKVIENSYQIVSIEFIAIVQAIDYLKINEKLSSYTKMIYKEIRERFPLITQDKVIYKNIESLKNFLQQRKLDRLI